MLNANGRGFFCPILTNGKGEIFPFVWDDGIVPGGRCWLAVHIPDVPSCLTGAWFEILFKILIQA